MKFSGFCDDFCGASISLQVSSRDPKRHVIDLKELDCDHVAYVTPPTNV